MYGYKTRRGEQAPNSRLTQEMREYIRQARAAGATYAQIAHELGVSIATVRRADQGWTYQDHDY